MLAAIRSVRTENYDCFEILPAEPVADASVSGSRYDHTISVFGAAFQRALGVRGGAWARTVSDSEVGLQRRARETRGDSHTWGLDVW